MANSENLDLKRLDEPKASTKFNHQIYYQNNFDKIDAAMGAAPSTLTTNAKTLVPAINELESEKVDKVEGKGLSTNDYTTTEKNKLAGIPVDTAAQLSGKVDKVEGKGLSTNDFDNTYKKKVDTDIPAQLADIENVKLPLKLDKAKEPYIYPTKLNGWIDVAGAFNNPLKYYKDNQGYVHVLGYITSGTAKDIARFPAGYRPLKYFWWESQQMQGNSGSVQGWVDGAGFFGVYQTGINVWIDFTFPTF